MNTSYKSKQVQKLCEDKKEAVRRLGRKIADKLFVIVLILKEVDNLGCIPEAPPTRRHKLTAPDKGLYWKGCWSIDLGKQDGYRVILEPDGGIDKNTDPSLIKSVIIREITCATHYH